MKISEMREIAVNRQNFLYFLNLNEIKELNKLLGENIDKKSFSNICNLTLAKYQAKQINNKIASKVFELLANANQNFKIEQFRLDDATKSIYRYNQKQKAYLFYMKGGNRVFKILQNELGRFVDDEVTHTDELMSY